MDRRAFIASLAGGLLAAPLAAEAQQAGNIARIGILTPAPGPSPLFRAFREGLEALGYVEGRNVTIEYRFAAGDLARLPALATELVRLPVQVIVTDGTAAALAAKRVTTSVPIVMAAVGDPVRSGIIENLARPGGNVTGLTLLASELSGKRLELLTEALSRVSPAACLWVAGNPNGNFLFEETRSAARTRGIEVRPLRIASVEGLDAGLRSVTSQGAVALIGLADVVLWNNRAAVVHTVARHRLPAIYEAREFAEAGGLMSYGLNIAESFRRAAGFVDRILKGANPRDLPVEQPTKFELVINLKTAKALGLTIPPSVLQRADQVIE